MVRYCAIIFGCLAFGELVVWATNFQFPSSIIGMILLTILLKINWIKLHWVQSFSNLLIANLGLFFVPPCIKMILYWDTIKENFLPILASILISTILVIYSTASIYQLLRTKKK